MQSEMIQLWQLTNGLTPMRSDCDMIRTDGLDTQALLLCHIKRWYENLLTSAPPRLLPIADLASQAEATADADGVVCITLPDECVRPLSVRLDGWHRPADIVDLDSLPPSTRHLMQSPLCVGGAINPLAVLQPDGTLRLYSSAASQPNVTSLLCVVRPPEGVFRLDPALLATIPIIDLPI